MQSVEYFFDAAQGICNAGEFKYGAVFLTYLELAIIFVDP